MPPSAFRRLFGPIGLGVLLVVAASCRPATRGTLPEPASERAPTGAASGATVSDFAGLVSRLSEEGAYFDTDNLISNEASYLHALTALRSRGITGGVYLGVGPDQNFSYIAEIRPDLAFIVDIRRDNLLQHLLYKALFAEAPTRIDFLCLLFGRSPPSDRAAFSGRSIREHIAFLDGVVPDSISASRATTRLLDRAASFGVPLSADDRNKVRSMHRRFTAAGLDLRFNSHGRPPMPYYPSYRGLLLETDLDGRSAHFLSDDTRYAFVRTLQLEDRVVPVVGDLGGSGAMPALADEIGRRGLKVSAFYTSNVEFYLLQDDRFDRFAANVRALPRTDTAVFIRSYFNRFRGTHPSTVPGYASTQLVQSVADFVRRVEQGGYVSYRELVSE